jgi:hypothetical protein
MLCYAMPCYVILYCTTLVAYYSHSTPCTPYCTVLYYTQAPFLPPSAGAQQLTLHAQAQMVLSAVRSLGSVVSLQTAESIRRLPGIADDLRREIDAEGRGGGGTLANGYRCSVGVLADLLQLAGTRQWQTFRARACRFNRLTPSLQSSSRFLQASLR